MKYSRELVGWAFYDFANSAFATSVLSVIFSVYFTKVLVPPEGVHFLGFMIPGESLWSYLISAVMFVVIFMAPLIGSIADQKGFKRRFLIISCLAGSLATMTLVSSTPERLPMICVMIFVATLGFEMSLVFYNAFLKDIADETTAGRASGFGFALGYVGGGLCLFLNMLMIKNDPQLGVRNSMLLVGAWWLLFSLPTFFWVKDLPPAPSSLPVIHPMETLRWIWKRPALKRFLVAYLIFEDGIQTVLLMASIFGAKALGMNASELVLCFLMIQFVAFVGAMACGRLADTWGHKQVLMTAIIIYGLVVVWAIFLTSTFQFWMLGVIVGLVMGGSQAAARSMYALMIPQERASEFFSLYSIVGKAAAFMGPLVFGVVTQFYGLRAGVGSLAIFFIVGGSVLYTVRDSKS